MENTTIDYFYAKNGKWMHKKVPFGELYVFYNNLYKKKREF